MAVGPPDVFDDQQPAVQCLDGGLDAAMQWSGDLLVIAFHESSFNSAGALRQLWHACGTIKTQHSSIVLRRTDRHSAPHGQRHAVLNVRLRNSCPGDAPQLSDAAKACLSDESVRQAVSEFMQYNDFKGAQVR